MSEDVEKLMRASLLAVKTADSLSEAIWKLEAIAGEPATALVDKWIAEHPKTDKK